MEIAHSIDNKHVHIFLCSVCKNKINIADLAPVKRQTHDCIFGVCVSNNKTKERIRQQIKFLSSRTLPQQ